MKQRIFILILFHAIINSCLGQNQKVMFEEDIKNLEQIKMAYGDSSKVYNDKLIKISYFYTQDTTSNKLYKDIAKLIINNNHIARELYGFDSPQYGKLMVALSNCLSMKFYNQIEYEKYSPLIKANLKELESLITKVNNNKALFSNLLSGLYSNFEEDPQLALKYAIQKYKIITKKYSKQTLEYRYSIEELIHSFAANGKYDEAIKYIKEREKYFGDNDDKYAILIKTCLNSINNKTPEPYIKYLIGRLRGQVTIKDLAAFHIQIAKKEHIETLKWYEEKYISKITDSTQLYEYYRYLGFVLTDSLTAPVALNYLLKAESIFLAHKNKFKTEHLFSNEYTKNDLYKSISLLYGIVKNYNKAIDYILKSLDYIKSNFPLQEEYIANSMHICSSYLCEYYHGNKEDTQYFVERIKNYLQVFYQQNWTLANLKSLYNTLAINSDYRFTNLIERLFCSKEKDYYSLYDYYLINAIYMRNQKLYDKAVNYFLKAIECCSKLNRRDLLYLKADKEEDYVHYLESAASCCLPLKKYELAFECYNKALSDCAKDFGENSPLYYNIYSGYINTLGSLEKYENIYHIIDNFIELSKRIYGTSSIEYQNNSIDKSFVLMKLGKFEESKKLIDSIKTKFTNIEGEKSLVLLLTHAECEKNTNCYNNAYDDYMLLLSSIVNIQQRFPVILELADMYGKVEDDRQKEILLTIDNEYNRIIKLNNVDSLAVCSFYDDLYITFRYMNRQKSFEYLNRSSEFTKKDDFVRSFHINRQLIDLKSDDTNYVLEKMRINEDLIKTKLRDKKNLYILLHRDWADYYFRNDEKSRCEQYFTECNNFYENNSTSLEELVEFKLHYARIRRAYGEINDAIKIYYGLKKRLDNQTRFTTAKEITLGCIIDSYLELDNTNMALKVFQEYKDIIIDIYQTKEVFGIHYYLGKIYFHKKQIDKAKQSFQEASKFVTSNLERYMLSEMLQSINPN